MSLPGISIEDVAHVVRKELARHEEQAKSSKGFSEVGSGEAEGLLAELNLEEVNGNEEEPIDVPNDAPQARDFAYEEYPDESSGTPFLLDHHAKQLKAYGIRFGQGGFKIYDLHSHRKIYSITSNSGRRYSGTVDGCIAPYALMASTACNHSRIAYEHKQSQEQKRAYCEMHPEQYKVRDTETPSGPITFDGGYKGQSVTAMLGAYAYNDFPLMIDLTDGVVHHLLQIRGTDLYMWTDLSSRQAYYKQAELLRSLPDLLPDRKLRMEAIPEDLQVPLKKMRGLRGSSGLKEQLDSVVPFLPVSERLCAAQEIIASWEQAAPRPMSSDVFIIFA